MTLSLPCLIRKVRFSGGVVRMKLNSFTVRPKRLM